MIKKNYLAYHTKLLMSIFISCNYPRGGVVITSATVATKHKLLHYMHLLGLYNEHVDVPKACCPQVWRTIKKPALPPNHLGSAPNCINVSAALYNKRS